MNQQLESMRKDHESLSLSTDQALAWHELGHAFAAASLGRLIAVTLRPDRADLGGRIAMNREGVNLSGDWFIAALGPAAQLLYMRRYSNPAPSSFFMEHYFEGPAFGDHRRLLANWPAIDIEQESFLLSVHALANLLGGNDEIVAVITECSRHLLEKGELPATELPPPPQSVLKLLGVVEGYVDRCS
jgi:hypothetical protein